MDSDLGALHAQGGVENLRTGVEGLQPYLLGVAQERRCKRRSLRKDDVERVGGRELQQLAQVQARDAQVAAGLGYREAALGENCLLRGDFREAGFAAFHPGAHRLEEFFVAGLLAEGYLENFLVIENLDVGLRHIDA